jgi:hypothetical protein
MMVSRSHRANATEGKSIRGLVQPASLSESSAAVVRSAEQMIANMQTEEHQQTAYVDSMERAMEVLDEPIDRGDWMMLETAREIPFVIGDAPVIMWKRLANGPLSYGHGSQPRTLKLSCR